MRSVYLFETTADLRAYRYHFAFLGPRGSGKKTVTNKLGWLFNALRLLPSQEVVHKPAQLLIESRAREDSSFCAKLIRECIGSILVIEDAEKLSVSRPSEPKSSLDP